MKPRDYCCCAIPMVNAGIYATLIEQFAIAILVGVLAVATPSIVGASVPSFAPLVLAIACFVVAAIQVLGFVGVLREKPKLYRTYAMLHGIAIAVAFSVAAVWIVMSAIRHRNAKDKCLEDFFEGDSDGGQGDTLCTIFPWVDVGIMGGLWVILGIFHIYLLVVVSSYGKSQRQDHDDYDRLYDPAQPLTKDNIPLAERKDPWDTRGSDEYLKASGDPKYHQRNASTASASDVINEPFQQPANYQNNYSGTYTPYSDSVNEPTYPSYAYTQQVAPTPVAGNYSQDYDSRLGRPSHAQAHPGES